MTHKELAERYTTDFANLNNALAHMAQHFAVVTDGDPILMQEGLMLLCENLVEMGITHTLVMGRYRTMDKEDEVELPTE